MPKVPRTADQSSPTHIRPIHDLRPVEAEPATVARAIGAQMEPAEYAVIFPSGPASRQPPNSAITRGDGGNSRSSHSHSLNHNRSRGRLIAIIAGVAALAFVAGGVVAATSQHSGSNTTNNANIPADLAANPPASASASAEPTPEATRAVAWVEGYVGPTHVVACDPIVCGLLGSAGFSSGSLEVVSGVANVEQADVVVLTGVLRTELGSDAGTLISPEPLAVFGTGSAEVEVAAVQLDGAADDAQAMAADRAGRRAAGAALLSDPHLTVDAQARALLSAGLVDSRVCALLALLTGTHTLTVAGFVPIGPGAGPDVPSAGVVIETIDGEPAAGASTAATGVLAVVKAQQDPYRPMSAATGAVDGRSGLRIVYSQPGPLGLLPGSGTPPLP
jgi:hypothetical protein